MIISGKLHSNDKNNTKILRFLTFLSQKGLTVFFSSVTIHSASRKNAEKHIHTDNQTQCERIGNIFGIEKERFYLEYYEKDYLICYIYVSGAWHVGSGG